MVSASAQQGSSAAVLPWAAGQQQPVSMQLAVDAVPAHQHHAGELSLSAQRHDRPPLREISPAERGGLAPDAWAMPNRQACARAQGALPQAGSAGGDSGSNAAGLLHRRLQRARPAALGQQYISSHAYSHPTANSMDTSGEQHHADEGEFCECWQCWNCCCMAILNESMQGLFICNGPVMKGAMLSAQRQNHSCQMVVSPGAMALMLGCHHSTVSTELLRSACLWVQTQAQLYAHTQHVARCCALRVPAFIRNVCT